MATAGAGSEPPRPPCNMETRGKLWPARANTDAEYARKAVQCGELRMCTKGSWRHRWERLAVHYSQLRDASSTAPGCEEFASLGLGKPEAKTRETAVE